VWPRSRRRRGRGVRGRGPVVWPRRPRGLLRGRGVRTRRPVMWPRRPRGLLRGRGVRSREPVMWPRRARGLRGRGVRGRGPAVWPRSRCLRGRGVRGRGRVVLPPPAYPAPGSWSSSVGWSPCACSGPGGAPRTPRAQRRRPKAGWAASVSQRPARRPGRRWGQGVGSAAPGRSQALRRGPGSPRAGRPCDQGWRGRCRGATGPRGPGSRSIPQHPRLGARAYLRSRPRRPTLPRGRSADLTTSRAGSPWWGACAAGRPGVVFDGPGVVYGHVILELVARDKPTLAVRALMDVIHCEQCRAATFPAGGRPIGHKGTLRWASATAGS
jgi:hypothetical protein